MATASAGCAVGGVPESFYPGTCPGVTVFPGALAALDPVVVVTPAAATGGWSTLWAVYDESGVSSQKKARPGSSGPLPRAVPRVR